MSFAARLRAGRFVVALEVTPPQRPRVGVLLRRAGLLGNGAGAINVIQRPDRWSSLEASLALGAAGRDPVWHLVNRGRTREEIAAEIATAHRGGIGQVLCIRGDHEASDTRATPAIREVVAMVRERMPEALIGATLNQYAADRAAVFRNLLPKLEAGAGYVQTQPVFDLKTLRPAAEALRDASPSTRIVAMVMPLLSIEAAQRIEARLGVRLPERLCRDLDHGGAEAGWCAFGEVIGALACSPLVDGVAVMTFEMDPSPEVRQRIVAALGAAGALHEEGGGDGQPAPRLCDQPGRA